MIHEYAPISLPLVFVIAGSLRKGLFRAQLQGFLPHGFRSFRRKPLRLAASAAASLLVYWALPCLFLSVSALAFMDRLYDGARDEAVVSYLLYSLHLLSVASKYAFLSDSERRRLFNARSVPVAQKLNQARLSCRVGLTSGACPLSRLSGASRTAQLPVFENDVPPNPPHTHTPHRGLSSSLAGAGTHRTRASWPSSRRGRQPHPSPHTPPGGRQAPENGREAGPRLTRAPLLPLTRSSRRRTTGSTSPRRGSSCARRTRRATAAGPRRRARRRARAPAGAT